MSEASVAAFWEERRAEDATLPPQVPEAWPFGATPAHADELLAQVRSLTAEARGFEAWARSRGYDVVDSEANFSLIGRFPDRHAVWQALCERGILIRETGPAGFLRVSAGTPDEMTLLRAALDDLAPEKEGTTP